ncbi:MAG TPA: winged helix DNA-binding protein [Candidatus Saccharibacteria bacterium]|nr:winged helix DNA-binding protein [Candidatus Saccharibacteria bacterium]
MNQPSQLTPNEAIVLQQVHEDGEDDTRTLAQQLGMSRQHILTIIERLKSKGLVAIDSSLDGLWVRLTRKGQHIMRQLWPEAHGAFTIV